MATEIVNGLGFQQDGTIGELILNRPNKKNAVTFEMWSAIANSIEHWISDNQLRVLIIRGEAGNFCAGADIKEFDTHRKDGDSARHYENANSRAFAAIRNAPFVTIAAIEGICFGGGFGIAAACDLRIAHENSIFCVPAARLGLAYPQDAMCDIVHSLGAQMARYLTFSAERLNAQQALQSGFLLEVLPQGIAERAQKIAATTCRNAPLSIRASKAAINSVLSGKEADAQLAKLLGTQTFNSHDYKEGCAAFQQKRAPRFNGN